MKKWRIMKGDERAWKKGSALLIVLGMVSFLVVSAVSFAIYMRQSRAPSAYVRRNAAARMLVKAALAHAIDEIDTAIGNDPYPGIGSHAGQNQSNYWLRRVFTPSNEVATASTIATLSLEALGYLPAPLINEVRYQSRHTQTAQWRSFDYDIGRYAFTAVDVSDFFDINEMKANVPRTSFEPVSLAGVFMNETYTDFAINPAQWDTAVSSALGSTKPLNRFYSLMDFNLLLRSDAWGGSTMKSPFWELINGANGSVYAGTTASALSNQVFVTDSYFPAAASTSSDAVDLSQRDGQPFEDVAGMPEAADLRKLHEGSGSSKFWNNTRISSALPFPAMAFLADYLDYDQVPCSLCLPTVETAPMLVGVEMDGLFSVTVAAPNDDGNMDPALANAKVGDTLTYSRTYSLKIDAEPSFRVSAVFPFKRMQNRGTLVSPYKVDVYARCFFVPDSGSGASDGGLRASGNDASLVDVADGKDRLSSSDWPHDVAAKRINACAIAFYGSATLSPNLSPEKQNDVFTGVAQVPLNPRPFSDTLVFAKREYTCKAVYAGEGLPPKADYDNETGSGDVAYNGIQPLDASWKKVELDDGKEASNTTEFRPSFAVWVRITDADGKVVDCAPAVPSFDGMNNFDTTAVSGFNKASGSTSGTPLLRFFADASTPGIQVNKVWLRNTKNQTEQKYTWVTKGYVANDPRYNWAPEDWLVTTSDPKTQWKTEVTVLLNNDGRDRDVFMSASDRGYLQSIYELMFIPWSKSISGSASEWGNLAAANYDGKARTERTQLAHYDLFWRTYSCDAFGGDGDDSLDILPVVSTSGRNRVNPYGGMTLRAAFVNTPYDWWAAASNHISGASERPPSDKTFSSVNDSLPYTFGPKSNDDSSQWDGEDVGDVVGAFSRIFQANINSSWTNVFDNVIDWSGGGSENNDPLHCIDEGQTPESGNCDLSYADRKYLYGFWRNCFQNEQQLFLVFVRSEPVSQGADSGSAGGARAVALVWRDPNPPTNAGGQDNHDIYLKPDGNQPVEAWRLKDRQVPPHRTRILFYRQFD